MPRETSPLEAKLFIIETLGLEDVRPEDIGDDEPLFGGGLDLDSIDGLELHLALWKTFGIGEGEDPADRGHLASARALAAFISRVSAPAGPGRSPRPPLG